MDSRLNREIQTQVSEFVSQTRDKREFDYDEYINRILRKLDKRQLENILFNFYTRVDRSLYDEQGYPEWARMRLNAKEKIESTPENLRCLLAIPLIAFRFDKFSEFVKSRDPEANTDPETVFWEFSDTFPIKNYYRALRVKPDRQVSFYSSMLLAPKLDQKFYDFEDTTKSPVIGDFEEVFTYHIYLDRSTKKSLVSWSEDPDIAFFAATNNADEFDPSWDSSPEASIFVMRVEANSFFFLDETEVNNFSRRQEGIESILVMGLPFRAIQKGGISFSNYLKGAPDSMQILERVNNKLNNGTRSSSG